MDLIIQRLLFFKISIKDSYSTVELLASVSTMECISNFEKKGVGVRKPYERGALDIYGSIYSNESLTLGDNEEHGLTTIAGKSLIKNNMHGGVDVGDERFGTVLCSKEALKFWDGNEAYNVFTEKNPPNSSQVGALPTDSPCFTGNMVQSRSGYAWIYHINGDIGSLNIAPRNSDGGNDWSKQFLLKRDGDVEISKNLKVRDISMQRCWLYDIAQIRANGGFDIWADGTGINGGPLYMNGNSTIKSVMSASETPIIYDLRTDSHAEAESILDEALVVSTDYGLRMIPKIEKCNEEGQPQGVDIIEIISALKLENEKIKQELQEIKQMLKN